VRGNATLFAQKAQKKNGRSRHMFMCNLSVFQTWKGINKISHTALHLRKQVICHSVLVH